jgi:hypothetical protein
MKKSLFILLMLSILFFGPYGPASAEEISKDWNDTGASTSGAFAVTADRESTPPPSKQQEEQQKENQPASQQLAPIKVVDEPVSKRKDLDPDSLINPYRVESSARFGTEVLTQEDIQNLQPSDIFDLIDKAIGINVTYQGRKHPFFVNQRGGGSFTYIIDGAVLPPSTDRILYKFPLAAIEQMQIVRGSTSLTLGPSIPIGASNSGSGLNTGFIIIRTKQPEKAEAVLSGSAEKATGSHPVAINASVYVGTDMGGGGVSKLGGYIGILAAYMDRPSEKSWFDGRSSKSLMGNTGLRAGKFNINAMAYTDRGRFEMQRGIALDGTLSDVKWYYDPLEANVFSSDMAVQWSPNQTTLLNLYHVKYEQTEHNDSFTSTTTVTKEYEEKTSGLGLRHNVCFFKNTLLQLSGQISRSEGLGPNLSRGYNKYDTTITGWSASVEQKLLDDDFVLDAGFRQDYKHIDHSSSGRNEAGANDNANNDVDMAPANIFALGAHWRMIDLLTLDGRYYHGEQGTVGDFDMRSEAGELHAENQDRIEVSLAADLASYFRPALTWFSIDVENAKSDTNNTYDLNGATYYYYTESDELRRGVELLIQGRIKKNTTYTISWTRMLDNETTSDGVTTDTIGLKNPENLYSLVLGYRWRAYKANFSIKKVDGWIDSRSPMGTIQTDGLGDYTRVDANIQREFEFNKLLLAVSLFGRNLLNEHYSTRYVTGFYPDRGLTVGMDFSLAYK